jgi:protein TonB
VNEVMQRMLPATVLTLGLHGALLSLHLPQPEVRPKPPAQKIRVTLKQLPPPMKKIVQQAQPLPELQQVQQQTLQKRIVTKPMPEPPKIASVQRQTLQKRIVTRPMPEPPKIVPVQQQTLQKRIITKPMPEPPTIASVQRQTLQKRIVTKPLPQPPTIAPIQRQPLQPIKPQPVRTVPVSPPSAVVSRQTHQIVRRTPIPVPRQPVRRSTPLPSRPPVRRVINTSPAVFHQPRTRQIVRRTPISSYQQLSPQQTRPTQPQPVRQQLPTPQRTVASSVPRSTVPVSTGVQEAAPLYQSNPPPEYPRQARRRGWEGKVILVVLVLEDGSAGRVELRQSSGHKVLDIAAMNTVKQWRFSPGKENGRPKSMEVLVPVHFKLD